MKLCYYVIYVIKIFHFGLDIVFDSIQLIHWYSWSPIVYCRNGTAFGGDETDLDNGSCDFLEVKEMRLDFRNGETSKKIKLQVNTDSKVCPTWDRYIIINYLVDFWK